MSQFRNMPSYLKVIIIIPFGACLLLGLVLALAQEQPPMPPQQPQVTGQQAYEAATETANERQREVIALRAQVLALQKQNTELRQEAFKAKAQAQRQPSEDKPNATTQ